MPANIFVATPSYKNTVSTYYAASLIEYTNVPGLQFQFVTEVNDSLVTRVRNKLFQRYQFEFNEKGYTHLFWQDDDVAVDGHCLLRLAESGLDAVGIAVPLKYDNTSRGIICAVSGVYEEVSPMLYKAEYVGTGAFLMSNKLVAALTEYLWDMGKYYYEVDNPNEIYEVFSTGVVDGLYLSEDWYLCELIKKLGFEIYVDSSSECTHADPMKLWTRPPLPVDERCFTEAFRGPLPEELQHKRWTPNDFRNPSSRIFNDC